VLVKELQSLCLNVELIGEKLAVEEDQAGEVQELATTDMSLDMNLEPVAADGEEPKKKKGKK